MIRFSVVGKVPAKSNSYEVIRRNGFCALKSADDVKSYQEKVKDQATQLMNQLGGIPFTQGRVELWIIWHRHIHDGKRRDLDNILKVVKDGMNKIIWDDDSQVSCIISEMMYDAEEEEWLDIVIQQDILNPTHIKRPRKQASTQTKWTNSQEGKGKASRSKKRPAPIKPHAVHVESE